MSQNFKEFLSTANPEIPIIEFSINLFLTAIMAFLLRLIYIKYGSSLSNREQLSKIFILLSMTTMLIIAIVKSSLALSLGLVGALSIIRFRAAIKEPEELTFLFFAIAIGLGMGANQSKVTILGFIIISIIIIIIHTFGSSIDSSSNLHLIIESKNNNKIDFSNILKILNNFCEKVDLRRFNESDKLMEISFLIEINKIDQLKNIKNEIKNFDPNSKVTFIDNKGII